MSYPILTTRIASSTFVMLRDRTRQIGELFGLDKLQNTRFITAVSEIARNAIQFAGGGSVAFFFDEGRNIQSPQHLVAVVSDSGPGIADVDAVLEGRPNSKGQIPMGLIGSKRLVDVLSIECPPGGGTAVTMEMMLPRNGRRLTKADLGKLADQLARQKAKTPLEELERQNREMLSTLQELRLRQLELQRADERKNQFVAMLAHELRNPLGTLQMSLEVMRRNQHMTPQELARRRDIMARQTDQLAQLVEDLMDVSRVSQGKIELVKLPLEVTELVMQAVEMTSSAIAEKQHTVQVNPFDAALWISGDATRLKQVLCNLIQNAARYTPAGGQLCVSTDKRGDFALIEVSDNGIGISPDLLPQVFDLFVQGDDAAPERRVGLGVGLTLVHRLVTSHGGEVAAFSEGLGKGSRFSVQLPLAPMPDPLRPQNGWASVT
ncbi:MAG: hypothetical protein JWR68_3039 [Polaromonas sp.]|nr:hypothetical protein [Polaromonas sp.]